MFRTLINAFKNKEVRTKILITIGILFLYRVGCWLPVPGISKDAFVDYLGGGGNNLLSLLSAVTGSALANGAIFALGISPYINASIIVQLLSAAIPAWEKYSKQGEDGRKKLNNITRYFTLGLATLQAVGITISWANAGGLATTMFEGTFFGTTWVLGVFVALMLIAGAMFTTWLGERITEIGVGNGISLIIFIGILSTAGQAILATVTSFGTDEMAPWSLLGFVLLALVIFGLIVFVDLAERRIPIQYAKQIKGRKQYGGQNTNIPIKINASGVMPIIFATAIITFPQMIAQMVAPTSGFAIWYDKYLGAGQPIYSVILALLIVAFSYFYASLQFNPEEVARNIQQFGGFIPGIRPGKPTYDHLKKISKRLTLFGAIFLAFIALIPGLLFGFITSGNTTLVNSMTATGMLIVVSVGLEFDKQLQSLMMMKQYKGFLK